MALRIEDTLDGKWVVAGRGELHLAILIERMRREGFEFEVSRPTVIDREIEGRMQTPYERVFIEVPEELSGVVLQKLGMRRGEMQDMTQDNGVAFMEFIIPTRGLLGYRTEFITDTRGLGIINTSFEKYGPQVENVGDREQGSLVAFESGVTNAYAITNAQDRGILFIGPALPVYKGQVIGQNARSEDMVINICKTKQLTNMRSKGEGTNVHVNAPRIMGLEEALEYIADDELVEVTPKSIRIRKKILDEKEAARLRVQGRL
jgi:GTP-binding protein